MSNTSDSHDTPAAHDPSGTRNTADTHGIRDTRDAHDRFEARLAAVERALTDTDEPPADLRAAAEAGARLDDHGTRLDDLGERVTELEAAVQAVRGYVGNVRHVNREVERRAAAALATAEELEERFEASHPRTDSADRPAVTKSADPRPPTGSAEPSPLPTNGSPSPSPNPDEGSARNGDRGLLARLRDAV